MQPIFRPDRSRAVSLGVFRATVVAALSCLAPAAASCPPGNLDGNDAIDGADLGLLLAQWGGPGTGDLNGDNAVDGLDLGLLLSAWGPCPVTPPFQPSGELAAVALASYPWASWVDTFNSDGGVGLAIDPLQHPAAAGRTALAWVVENRSAAQWASDATLVDARSAGAQAVTIPASTLQGNVIALNVAGLVAGSGDAPARGYDLVVDLDASGTLSPGDLIDGGGDAPGFWWTRDIAAAGPYSTASIASHDVNDPDIIDTMELERIYYPTNAPGARPIVVISHGNGHQYTWYDYLGTHLASWGYVVMSHQNDTVPGIETATTTTLEHTESFIAQHAGISGGVLAGKVDVTRIAWIGHSRGGEGVARGYDRLFDGSFTSPSFGLGNVKCVISIAPTDFLGAASANPQDVPYMLLYGSADGDVCGCPDSDIADSFNLFERARGMRHSCYVQGADHNDFNCCGFDDFTGPSGTAIGRTAAQQVAKGAILAMLRRAIQGDRAMEEFLWRQNEALRPAGQPASVTVTREWKTAGDVAVVIDDMQVNTSTALSSSGGAVVSNWVEAVQNDLNTSFTWLSADPMNGAVRARSGETTRAMLFDWTSASRIEWSIPQGLSDIRDRRYLSFRAAQGTRHPNTIAALGDLDLTVVLRDRSGNERSVRIGAFGGGIEEPYRRTGFGTGTGWQNEMETIRIKLADIRSGAGVFDFSDVAAVEMRFGGSDGSAVGRLVLDDLRWENE
jgi:predicted dienelactone hydrolase